MISDFYNDKLKDRILTKAGLIVETKAKQIVPSDTSILKMSIKPSDKDIDKMNIKVGTDVDYAYYMEYGAKPHMPPFKPIKKWAERHNIEPWAVMMSIKKKGIEKGTVQSPKKTPSGYRPFLRPAGHQSINRIKEMLINEMKKEIRKYRKS